MSKEKLKELAVWGILLPVYVQIRILYLPFIWIGIPGYVNWATTKRENDKGVKIFYFVNRDLKRLAVAYIWIVVSWFLSWLTGCELVYGIMATTWFVLLTSILYWFVMKFVKE